VQQQVVKQNRANRYGEAETETVLDPIRKINEEAPLVGNTR
jgi:hypothetical protein